MALTVTRPRANSRRTIGTFLWADLQAKDLKTALDFYARTLGWEYRDVHDETGTLVYDTAHIGDVRLAGIAQMQEQAAANGMPSVWTNYVYVSDVDATIADVTRLGGAVMMPAMDVMDQGRMAIVTDPTGAAFGLWQPREHTGADALLQPSALTWVELFSSDVEGAKQFYTQLFGWGVKQMDQPSAEGSPYFLFTFEDREIAGLMRKPDDLQIPDCWITYYGVADVEAVDAEVKAAGGQVIWGPMQTGPGRSIGVIDPQGAIVHLIQMDEWPAL